MEIRISKNTRILGGKSPSQAYPDAVSFYVTFEGPGIFDLSIHYIDARWAGSVWVPQVGTWASLERHKAEAIAKECFSTIGKGK